MTIATTKTMTLAELALCAGGVADMIDEATALNPAECSRMPILDSAMDEVLDGFHRTAGMLLWARERDLSAAEVTITVVVLLDDELIDSICEHGQEDASALASIYN